MIKVRFTWPMLFILLLALAVWLLRDPGKPSERHACKAQRPMPRAPRPSRQPNGTRRFTIDMNGGSDNPSDYDAETERLDNEAFEAATREGARHSANGRYRMPRGAWQHD